MTKPRVAVLVLNRNMREMTEGLIHRVHSTANGVDYVLFSIDACSDPDQRVEEGADVLIDLPENRRWAYAFWNGLAISAKVSDLVDDGVKYAYRSGKGMGWLEDDSGSPFTHYWCLCNDTQLDPERSTLSTLLDCMPPDAAQIHPYQHTYPRQHSQGGRKGGRPMLGDHIREESFIEFVCPLLSDTFVRACIQNFQALPVNRAFPYGWGVDYEMGFFGHQLKMKGYICEDVGITHHPGTTHLNHEQTKVEDNNQMRVLARNSMLDVLEARYGRNWGEQFANSARAAGVDPQAFLEWSVHDRSLALTGARS